MLHPRTKSLDIFIEVMRLELYFLLVLYCAYVGNDILTIWYYEILLYNDVLASNSKKLIQNPSYGGRWL